MGLRSKNIKLNVWSHLSAEKTVCYFVNEEQGILLDPVIVINVWYSRSDYRMCGEKAASEEIRRNDRVESTEWGVKEFMLFLNGQNP